MQDSIYGNRLNLTPHAKNKYYMSYSSQPEDNNPNLSAAVMTDILRLPDSLHNLFSVSGNFQSSSLFKHLCSANHISLL